MRYRWNERIDTDDAMRCDAMLLYKFQLSFDTRLTYYIHRFRYRICRLQQQRSKDYNPSAWQ